MNEFEIENFLNKVDAGLAEAQHDMLLEKSLHNQPVIISDGNGHVIEASAQSLLAKKS